MSLLAESKKQYLFVMVTELTILSGIYWLLFNFRFSSLLVYVLAAFFYITMYRVWLKIFDRREHLLFHPTERFSVISLIILLSVLAINAHINPLIFTGMFYVYIIMFFIFVFYYFFRIKKQKKSTVPIKIFSSTAKILTSMCGIFLIFDLIVFLSGKFSLQLILYLPFLFLILSFIISVYNKSFRFNSFSSLILFFNIYIIATLMLVLNYVTFNFFSFTVIAHFVIFSAVVFVILENSLENENVDSMYSMENTALIFSNIVLIFIALNNVLSVNFPDIFVSYLYFVSILFLIYLGIKNYKMI